MQVDVEEIIASQKDLITASLTRELQKSISESLKWTLMDKVTEVAKEFIATEIAPQVKATLLENKVTIIAEIQNHLDEMFKELAKQMAAKATENLARSWNVKKITEALFD